VTGSSESEGFDINTMSEPSLFHIGKVESKMVMHMPNYRDHLQPVNAYVHNSEMLARMSYEQRINELEQWIREHEPNAEILNRISYGQSE
jgi:hypothetical protein